MILSDSFSTSKKYFSPLMANKFDAPAFFSSYHFAVIVSEKMKRREIKYVI